MTAYFERYAEAFDAFDATAIAGFYRAPCLMVNDRDRVVLPTVDAVVANMEALCEEHRRQGYGRAHVLDVRVRTTSPRVRHAEVDWRIDDPGHTPLASFTYTYQLTRDGDDWRILVATLHPAS